ncbi:MAG: type IV secretion system DNA-binding domain-containing protein [Candidatus Kerfeldbacteria bacterium]|nr:type IV secretion system DNA-binding domain-containing protein [Candidatus Kerfeldbacteria bacterium]
MSNVLTLGNNALTGERIQLELRDIFSHWAIIGGSGRGKSRLLAAILMFCMLHHVPVIVLDPGEELYRWGVSYAAAASHLSRLCCIDLNDQQYSFGFDWKKGYGVSSVTLFDLIYKAICKVYGQSDSTVAPLTETWMRNTLVPLIENPQATLAEMLEFASPSHSLLRAAILRNIQNDYIRREWESFESLKRYEREQLVMAVHNRAAKLTIPNEARRMLGQLNPAFDLARAIEERKVILVNLAPTRVSRELQRTFAITLINQVVNYAYRRSPKERKRGVLVLCDEASEYASDDLPLALDKLRKFGVYFVLSYQTLAQAEKIPGYLDSLFTNTDVKIAFRTSRRDAEELVGEMFPDGLTKREVKDEIIRTAWDPKESRRTVKSYGRAHGRSSTSGESSSSGHSSGLGGGLAWSHSQPLDGDHPYSGSQSYGWNNSRFEATMDSDSSISAESESESESESEAIVPFYEFLARNEVSSRTFYSVSELRERFISWFLLQPRRHAQVKIGDRSTVPMITTYVPDVRVREKDLQKAIMRSNLKYALPVAEVDRQIEQRRTLLLQGAEQELQRETEAVEVSRWH